MAVKYSVKFFAATAWAVVIGSGLAACSSEPRIPAPVVERSGGGAPPVAISEPPPAPMLAPAAPEPLAPAGPGFYRVKPGDTLYGIARAQKQKPADLAHWNNLPPSLQVNIDQLLRVAPPGAATASAASPDNWSKSPQQPPLIGGGAGSNSSSGAASAASKSAAPRTAAQPEHEEASTASASKGSIALAWPAQGDVVTKFGGGSKGIDIEGKVGEPVKAAAPGKVVYAGSGLRAYGQMIIVKHGGDYLTAYAHNSKLLVREGDTVKQGATIAEMGVGTNNKPLLHFELRKSGQAVDPLASLGKGS